MHDGADTKGVGLPRHLVDALEQAAVSFDGALGQVDAVCANDKLVTRLVEANVPVVADAQKLQVNATGSLDCRVVVRAGRGGVLVRPVRHVRPRHVDVHPREQVLPHEVVVALRVIVRKASVLIQVVALDLSKAYLACSAHLDEAHVGTQGRAARGQAQGRVRL